MHLPSSTCLSNNNSSRSSAHALPAPQQHSLPSTQLPGRSWRGRPRRSCCLHVAAAAATLEQEVLKEDPVLRQKKELQQMMDRDYKVRGDTTQIHMRGCLLQPAVTAFGRP